MLRNSRKMSDDGARLLMRAIDNESNASMEGLTTASMKSMKNNMLQQLGMGREQLTAAHAKLRAYRFIEDLDALRYGAYVRWFDLTRDEPRLTNGGIVCDMVVTDTGVSVRCKNQFHRMFSFNLSECMVFQKLSEQELVLLSALDYLNS